MIGRREHEEEVEDEERVDDQQAERDQPGPQQPLPQVDVRLVPVEGSRPDVVEDEQRDQQHQRRDPGRVEQVGEVVAVEGREQVVPGREGHGCLAAGGGFGRPEYAMADAILGRSASARAGRAVGDGTERSPGCEPCCQSPTGRASPRSPAICERLGVEMFATDGTREHLAGEGIEVASVTDLINGRTTRRRPGQDLPSRGLRRHPRAPRRARPAGRAQVAGHRPDRPRRRQRQGVRAVGRGEARRSSTRRSR